jgi:hypothetical protein
MFLAFLWKALETKGEEAGVVLLWTLLAGLNNGAKRLFPYLAEAAKSEEETTGKCLEAEAEVEAELEAEPEPEVDCLLKDIFI